MERQVSVVTDIFKMKQIQPLYPVSLKASQMEADGTILGQKLTIECSTLINPQATIKRATKMVQLRRICMESSKHNWANISETICPEMLDFGK